MKNSEYIQLVLEERQLINKKEERNQRLVKEKVRNDRYLFESALNDRKEMNKINESYYDKVKSLKESLLYECIYNLYNKSLGSHLETGVVQNIKQSLVTSFIQEQGADRLIASFKTKNYILSEFYRTINKYMDLMLESKKEKSESKDEDNSLEIEDDYYEDDFFEDIDTDDVDDVAQNIKARVSAALNDFISANAKEQVELKELIQQTQDNIQKASEDPDKDPERIKESYEFVAKGKMNKIQYSRNKGIFESMITNIADSTFKDDNLRNMYMESGSLDVDTIVENARIIYTFLEMVNTTNMIDINESYVKEMLNSFKK